MSKAADKLRESRICNDYELVRDQAEPYFVHYSGFDRATVGGWRLGSPAKVWDGPWYDHGALGLRCESHPKALPTALAKASKECGVSRWSPSPFNPRTGFVPTSVLEARGIKPIRVIEVSTTPGGAR